MPWQLLLSITMAGCPLRAMPTVQVAMPTETRLLLINMCWLAVTGTTTVAVASCALYLDGGFGQGKVGALAVPVHVLLEVCGEVLKHLHVTRQK